MVKSNGLASTQLLGIIAILGIVSLMAIYTVTGMTNNNYEKKYQMNLQTMEQAAKSYLDRSSVKIADGETKILTIKILKDAGIMTEVLDPKNNNECDGYVTATSNNGDYLFMPYLKCQGNYISNDYVEIDTIKPVLALVGNSNITINKGESYSDEGATAIDDIDGDITISIKVTGTVNQNIPGTYTITYTVSDMFGNISTLTRTINVIDTVNNTKPKPIVKKPIEVIDDADDDKDEINNVDNVIPTVTFEPNGKNTYAKSRNTKVVISDNVSLDSTSLKYLWNTSTMEPTETSFSMVFDSGAIINTPKDVTGGYYLWILAKDSSGNTIITRSNVFNLDNISPEITLVGDSNITIGQGDTYSDAGAIAYDNIDGDITASIESTGTINSNEVGTYTVTYNVSDSSGNLAVTVMRAVDVISMVYDEAKGVNRPKLADGMTPIKWNGIDWISTKADDLDWYNYNTTDKKWANARTADGSMWVWLPRYIYKISSGWHTSTTGTIDVQFSKGVDDNWNKESIGAIDLGETANASNGAWTNHPAFTFGNTELTGIWVAKFEATAAEGLVNGYTSDGSCPIASDNVATKTIKLIPNVASWRCIQIGNAFTAARNMEINSVYGWGTTGDGIDTHLMKNIEWGVTAYLTQSIYGKMTEISVNKSSNYYTGGGIADAYITNVSQSTTGNIYGIYDLSGGAYERVAAYVDNRNNNLNNYGLDIISANLKYKDIYQMSAADDQAGNYALTGNKKGDAIYETSNNISGNYAWNGDYTYIPYFTVPWFSRGCYYTYDSPAGIFAFGTGSGFPSSRYGFRPVLVVNAGL